MHCYFTGDIAFMDTPTGDGRPGLSYYDPIPVRELPLPVLVDGEIEGRLTDVSVHGNRIVGSGHAWGYLAGMLAQYVVVGVGVDVLADEYPGHWMLTALHAYARGNNQPAWPGASIWLDAMK